jgi:hypothetical protein
MLSLTPPLERLLREAGFTEAVRRDEYFFRPLLAAS